MKIGREQVAHVAQLARLEFSEAELDRFATQMSAILDYVEKLGELDLAGVEPTAHVLEVVNALRDDVVRPSLERPALLANAPRQEDGCFRVAKIIDG